MKSLNRWGRRFLEVAKAGVMCVVLLVVSEQSSLPWPLRALVFMAVVVAVVYLERWVGHVLRGWRSGDTTA